MPSLHRTARHYTVLHRTELRILWYYETNRQTHNHDEAMTAIAWDEAAQLQFNGSERCVSKCPCYAADVSEAEYYRLRDQIPVDLQTSEHGKASAQCHPAESI